LTLAAAGVRMAPMATVTEHWFLALMLFGVALETAFVGCLAYKVYRSSQQLEGLMAATYLEARRSLERLRQQG